LKIGPHGAGANGIVMLDPFPHRLGICAGEPSHEDAHAKLHRRAHAHADDLRQVAKKCCGAPALDQDVALLRDAQNFLGRVVNEPLTVDPPALNERCGALHVAEERARLNAEPFGDAVGDDLGANDLQSESRGHARRHLHAAGTDLPRHCDHSHDRLLFTGIRTDRDHEVAPSLDRPCGLSDVTDHICRPLCSEPARALVIWITLELRALMVGRSLG
jgi:hypothetical protein